MVKSAGTFDKCQSKALTRYQQALVDFNIIILLQKLILEAPIHLEVEERESLAARLIELLAASLDSSLIAQCLNPMHPTDGGTISDLIAIELNTIPSSIILSEDLLYNSLSVYSIGDKVQWKPLPDPTDWGIVIGRFYAYAHHRCQWGSKYVIWLDQDSPSAAWIAVDTAWEEDLEIQK